jgi:hypothetical protein
MKLKAGSSLEKIVCPCPNAAKVIMSKVARENTRLIIVALFILEGKLVFFY